MKNAFIRAISAGLSALLIAAELCSCQSGGGADSETTTSGETSPAATAESTDEYGRKIIESSLPAGLDFKGCKITLLTRETPQYLIDFYAEALNGEIVNDAVYERNVAVEEKLKVSFASLTTPDKNTTTTESVGDLVRTAVLAGDAAYDVAAFYQFYGGSLSTSGMLLNLMDTKYLDFEKPWWNQDFYNELTYAGQLYNFVGDLNLSVTSMLMGVFFNQKTVTDYHKGYDFLYKSVYDGKWTFDEFQSLTKDVYSDLNGDGKRDESDFYGLVMVEDNPGPWVSAFDIRLCTKDAKGVPQLSFYSPRSVTAYEKLYDYYRDSEGVYFGAKGFDYNKAFAAGQSLFAISLFRNSETVFREMEDGYGVLPMPKYDEAQENYYNTAHDNSNLCGIVTNTANPDAVCAALELMNYYSYQSVTPAYFEVAMKVKYLADSDSANMFDIIREGATVDFGTIYSLAIGGGTYSMTQTYHVLIRNLIRQNIRDIASQYAKNEPVYQKCLADIIAQYDKLAK